MDDEYKPDEKDAVACGLALLQHEWTGESDFDKGVRLLQEKMGIKKKKKVITDAQSVSGK